MTPAPNPLPATSGLATPSPAELQALVTKAIHLLDAELDQLEPGQRADLIRVLTELRHQIAALTKLLAESRTQSEFEATVLSVIRRTDERLWLEVARTLEIGTTP